MLILSRKPNESIIIDGRIVVRVLRVDGEVVKLGIQAPGDVPIHREEVYREIQQSNQAALLKGRSPLPKVKPSRPAQPPTPAPSAAPPAAPGSAAPSSSTPEIP